MNVLSLFDGMGCGLESLKRFGIKVDNYYASEIDKHAITVCARNHPEVIQLGDVEDWETWDLPKIDMIIAGSPCQGFSFAGKQLAFDDPRSRLYFKFVDCVRHFQPEFVLLENVIMKSDYQDVITDTLQEVLDTYDGGVINKIKINSSLVCAQNRKRLYWTNWETCQPEDRKIYLKDILINAVPFRDKAHCLRGKGVESVNDTDVGRFFNKSIGNYVIDLGELEVDASRYEHLMHDIHEDCVIDDYNQRVKKDGKACTLTPNSGSPSFRNGQKVAQYASAIKGKYKKGESIAQSVNDNLLYDGLTIRKFHPVECERLQTMPDGYCSLGIEKVIFPCMIKVLGNDRNTRSLSCENVQYRIATSQSALKKLACVINTTCDGLEKEQPTKDLPSIKASVVSTKDVRESNKHLSVFASSTIKPGNETSQKRLLNVPYVVQILDTQVGVDYVLDMQPLSEDLETLTELTKMLRNMLKEHACHMETMDENIIRLRMDSGCIELLLRKNLEDLCGLKRSFIMSILTNLIIAKKIYTSVAPTQSTYLCIDSLNRLQENLSETELSSLSMDNIVEISNHNQYKMLGNGWTAEVIIHIFNCNENLKQRREHATV